MCSLPSTLLSFFAVDVLIFLIALFWCYSIIQYYYNHFNVDYQLMCGILFVIGVINLLISAAVEGCY